MKSILLTGANGFIGSTVLRHLVDRGHTTRAFIQKDTDVSNISDLDVEIVAGDLRDEASLQRAVSGCETIFHFAAYNNLWVPDPHIPFEVNVGGTQKLLRLAKENGVSHFIHTGSATLFSSGNGSPATEKNFLTNPPIRNGYEHSKYLAEKAALESESQGFKVVCLEPTAPVGSGDVNLTGPGRLIVDFLKGNVPAYFESGINIVDIECLAKAAVKAIDSGKSGEQYILGGVNVSFKEFFDVLASVSNLPPPKWRVPYWFAHSSAWIDEKMANWITKKTPMAPLEGVRLAKNPCYFDCRKAKQDLLLEQTHLRQCLETAVSWFRINGFCGEK